MRQSQSIAAIPVANLAFFILTISIADPVHAWSSTSVSIGKAGGSYLEHGHFRETRLYASLRPQNESTVMTENFVERQQPKPPVGVDTNDDKDDLLDDILTKFIEQPLKETFEKEHQDHLEEMKAVESDLSSSSSDFDCLTRSSESQEAAIEDVAAILDLHISENDFSGTTGISEDIITKALEGLVQKIFLEDRKQPVSHQVVEKIEALFWRLEDLGILPTELSIETLWMLQQRSHQTNRDSKVGKHIGRSVRLLVSWCQWSQTEDQNETPISPPPFQFISNTFRIARENNVTMSFRMWDLYEYFHENSPITPSRHFYTSTLNLLRGSPLSWKVRQCDVLHHLERLHQAKNDHRFAPTLQELEAALVAASKAGQAREATWLFRTIRSRYSKTETHSYLNLWFQSLRNSQELGSTKYMENMLLASQNDNAGSTDFDLMLLMRHRYYYNMVLEKISIDGQPGSGMKAQQIFATMLREHRNSGDESLRPDEESIHHVIMAYIQEENSDLQHLWDAQRFLRSTYQALGPVLPSTRSFRTMDKLLEAFTAYRRDPRAVQSSTRLFRFFLLSHRDGKTSEEPDSYHLGHILKILHESSAPEAVEKSLEFFRLLESLYKRRTIRNKPDAYNVRQLLAIIAKSGAKEYGSYAEKLLRRVTSTRELPDFFDNFVVGQVFWYAIKCNCNGLTWKDLDRADAILNDLEQFQSQDCSGMLISGIPYKILISSWARLGGKGSGSRAESVLNKLERHHNDGNRFTKLTDKQYADVLLAWANDPSPNSVQRADQLYKRFLAEGFTAGDSDDNNVVKRAMLKIDERRES